MRRNMIYCSFSLGIVLTSNKSKTKRKNYIREEAKLNMYAIPHCVDLLCTTSDMQTSHLKTGMDKVASLANAVLAPAIFPLGRKN